MQSVKVDPWTKVSHTKIVVGKLSLGQKALLSTVPLDNCCNTTSNLCYYKPRIGFEVIYFGKGGTLIGKENWNRK